ncbi:DNA phosphorothioation-associated putative methyltransferase [Actinosynnema mirum]|uniref:DNA phosphorothioation-associated putative methyltransferase n=1 Tax=Actinosynnema mirum TaxID=40567 RepID=UPI003CCB3E72
MTIVDRGRTAMMRTGLSKPMAAALSDALLQAGLSVFDYGCGRGGDVLRLSALGYDVTGWDPDHAASSPHREADIVNLGYVVNVIEDPLERVDVLRSAWSLARQILVVVARPDWEARHVKGRRHGDGVLTTKGTFQKFFKQDELRSWIDTNLDARSIAAAPGIFYVFRDDSRGHQFLASRVRHGRYASQAAKLSETLRDAHRSLLDPIIRFAMERGRLPDPREVSDDAEICEAFGSTKRALAIVRACVDRRGGLEESVRSSTGRSRRVSGARGCCPRPRGAPRGRARRRARRTGSSGTRGPCTTSPLRPPSGKCSTPWRSSSTARPLRRRSTSANGPCCSTCSGTRSSGS